MTKNAVVEVESEVTYVISIGEIGAMTLVGAAIANPDTMQDDIIATLDFLFTGILT
jgi:hypothetical protein